MIIKLNKHLISLETIFLQDRYTICTKKLFISMPTRVELIFFYKKYTCFINVLDYELENFELIDKNILATHFNLINTHTNKTIQLGKRTFSVEIKVEINKKILNILNDMFYKVHGR